MGEYYRWVNVDKREYLSPSDFNYGNKFWETMHKDSAPLLAMYSLLNEEWNGDRVVWFGDECSVSKNSTNGLLRELYLQSEAFGYPEDAFDMICESYRNVSCLFKEAEKDVREEIGYYLEDYREHGEFTEFNEYGIDPEKPFEGLFTKTGRRFKYVINHTRKVFYSLEETTMLNMDGALNEYSDPISTLMGYGRVAECGDWVGDVIGVSDQRPEDYLMLSAVIVRW